MELSYFNYVELKEILVSKQLYNSNTVRGAVLHDLIQNKKFHLYSDSNY